MRRQSYALSVEQSPVVNQRAPMFVLPVKDVIGLDGLRTHEELQAMGKLVEWEAGMGDVMFVSQTWLRKEHADDEQGSKFKLLKVWPRLVTAWPCHAGPAPRVRRIEALCTHTPCAVVCPCPICAAAAPATGFLGAEVLGFFGMFWDVWGEFGGASGIQALLMRALAGKLDIASFWAVEAIYGKDIGYSAAEMKQRLSSGFVWFDIWSVPQIDCAKKKASTLPLAPPCEPLQPVAPPAPPPTPAHTSSNTPHPGPTLCKAAILSIAAFIATSCSLFMVLAGPWTHENGESRDYHAWERRGWCRLELAANTLSPISKPLIVAQSLNHVESYPAKGLLGMGFLHSPVCEGDFSDAKDLQVPEPRGERGAQGGR